MMRFRDWMIETAFVPQNQRKHELKALDEAFCQFEKLPSESAQAALQERLKSWVEAEGRNWREKPLNQRGTVQKLFGELFTRPAVGDRYERVGRLEVQVGPEIAGRTMATTAQIKESYGRLLGLVEKCRDEMAKLQRAPDAADEGEVNRYEQWFGPVTDARAVNTVAGVFQRMLNELQARTIIIYALPESKKHAFAFVYPHRPRPVTIYLGDSFFVTRGPLQFRFQASSQASAATLVHECSHLDYIGDTEDHAYGEEECLNVPTFVAVDNADNYAFYAISFVVDLWH